MKPTILEELLLRRLRVAANNISDSPDACTEDQRKAADIWLLWPTTPAEHRPDPPSHIHMAEIVTALLS